MKEVNVFDTDHHVRVYTGNDDGGIMHYIALCIQYVNTYIRNVLHSVVSGE